MWRALWGGGVLAVHGNRGRRRLTHHTAADVRSDVTALKGHAGHGGGGGQPVGLVVAAGVVTGAHVAVGEGHGGEETHTRARLT